MNNFMSINLAKGFFNAVEGGKVLKVDFNDVLLPNSRYEYHAKDYESRFPSIAEAYEMLLRGKYSQDEIIDILIHMYLPLKFFKVGDYEKMVLVLGFIGQRGSGKTCSAVMVAACDFLFRGMPVWSNVPIKIRVFYKDAERIYESKPLDELDLLDISEEYGGGCVLYDEINMEAAESTRFNSSANLKFSYAMQQIRKRKLSLIWTCQGWSWIDNRLRWQTDFCVACRDASFENKKHASGGIGDKTLWRVHDLSGTSGQFDYDFEIKHRYISDFLTWSGLVWLRPWWRAYNTDLLQGKEDYVYKYKTDVEQKRRAERSLIPLPDDDNILPGQTTTIEAEIDAICATGASKIRCSDVWESLNIKDKGMQTLAGKIFRSKGYTRAGDSKSGRYWKKEKTEVEA